MSRFQLLAVLDLVADLVSGSSGPVWLTRGASDDEVAEFIAAEFARLSPEDKRHLVEMIRLTLEEDGQRPVRAAA